MVDTEGMSVAEKKKLRRNVIENVYYFLKREH